MMCSPNCDPCQVRFAPLEVLVTLVIHVFNYFTRKLT
jgi:hypothetical protein